MSTQPTSTPTPTPPPMPPRSVTTPQNAKTSSSADVKSPSPTTSAPKSKEADKTTPFSRAFSTDNASKLVKAYATTWIGMSPIYLMGEALMPGRKVGTTFRKGGKELYNIAEEITKELSTSAEDIIVVMDRQLKSTNAETSKVAQLVKEAGQNAIVLVTSNLEKAQSQIQKDSPAMKHAIIKHSKDVIILADKSLKNPVVITGITKFARSKGIPRPEAMIGLASLGLAKILELIEKEITEFEAKEGETVVEVDAEELHRVSTAEAEKEAEDVTKLAHEADKNVQEGSGRRAGTVPQNADGKGKKNGEGCVIC